jgi:hypothetical protein
LWSDSPGGELLEALLVVRVVFVGTLDAGDAESSGLVETLDARCDLDTGLCGCADGAGSDAEEGHCGYECEDRARADRVDDGRCCRAGSCNVNRTLAVVSAWPERRHKQFMTIT